MCPDSQIQVSSSGRLWREGGLHDTANIPTEYNERLVSSGFAGYLPLSEKHAGGQIVYTKLCECVCKWTGIQSGANPRHVGNDVCHVMGNMSTHLCMVSSACILVAIVAN